MVRIAYPGNQCESTKMKLPASLSKHSRCRAVQDSSIKWAMTVWPAVHCAAGGLEKPRGLLYKATAPDLWFFRNLTPLIL
jgi:hypothetical protein